MASDSQAAERPTARLRASMPRASRRRADMRGGRYRSGDCARYIPRPMRLPPLEACLLAALAACSAPAAGGPPEGFELVYSQDFESAGWCTDFGASDPELWASDREGGGGTAFCRGSSGREGPFGSPPDFLWL